MENDWINIDIAATSVVVDDVGRYWIWDQKHSEIGYFSGDIYKFHVEGRYAELPFCFQGLDMYLRENVIFIISKSRIEVLTFDITERTFQMYCANICQQSSQYYSYRKNDKKIMFVPSEMKASCIEFDMDKKDFKEKHVISENTYVENMIWRLEDCNENVLIPVLHTGDILILNKEKCSYKRITFPYSQDIQCICEGKNHEIWASVCNRKELIRYFDGNEERIQLDENEKVNEPFSKLMYYQDKVIALPRYAKNIYIYDTLEKHIQKVNLTENIDIPPGTASLMWEGFIRQNKLICLPWRYPVVCEIDLNSCQCHYEKVKMNAKDYFKRICGEFSIEYDDIGLEHFIRFSDFTKKNLVEKDKKIGMNIWDKMK